MPGVCGCLWSASRDTVETDSCRISAATACSCEGLVEQASHSSLVTKIPARKSPSPCISQYAHVFSPNNSNAATPATARPHLSPNSPTPGTTWKSCIASSISLVMTFQGYGIQNRGCWTAVVAWNRGDPKMRCKLVGCGPTLILGYCLHIKCTPSGAAMSLQNSSAQLDHTPQTW